MEIGSYVKKLNNDDKNYQKNYFNASFNEFEGGGE